MEVIALGRYGRYPGEGGANSSYLIRSKGKNILIDMGSGAISRMQKFIKIDELDAIILTHLHFDHTADFFPFNYMITYKHNKKERDRKIDIYLPSTPIRDYEYIISDNIMYSFHTTHGGMSIKIGELDITFMKTKHPVECYAVRIREGERTLLYTADTVVFDGIEKLFDGADVVIGDACMLDSEINEKSPHLSVKQLASLAKNVSARLLLAHLPDNEKDIACILDEAKSVTDRVEVVEEMKKYII